MQVCVLYRTDAPHLELPSVFDEISGEKRTLIAHLFSNLVPERATIVELSSGCEFSLARWKMHNGTFHRINTMFVSPAIFVF